MSKIELSSISSGYLTAAQLNNNFIAIEDEFNDKVLYRLNPVGEPNQMSNSLDMNSFQILNLPEPVDPNDPLRLQDIGDITGDAQQSADDAAVSAAEAAASAAAALVSENNTSSSAAAALVSENNAATSETNASTSETNASTSASNASDSETTAMEWAINPEDDPVTTSPDEFSAFHWAQKAEATQVEDLPPLFHGNIDNPLVDLKLKNEINFTGVGTPSFTRVSSATYVDRYGVVQYSEGGSATNLALQSETFDNATWLKTASSVVANTVVAPDGTLTADSLIENGATSEHYIQQTVTAVAGTSTASIYIKSLSGNRSLRIRLFDDMGVPGAAYFNPETGTTHNVDVGVTAVMEPLDDGWFRCSATGLFTGTLPVCRVQLVPLGSGGATYTGDGSSGLYIRGYQFEDTAPFANGYVKTTTTSATADVAGKLRFEAEGALLEGASTNLALRSEEFDNAVWIELNSTVTPNTTTAPDGTLTADTLTADGTVTTSRIQQTVASSGTVTFSVFAKDLDSGEITFRINGTDVGGGGEGNTFYTFTFATKSWANASGGVAIATSFEELDDDWFRLAITVVTTTVANVFFYPSNDVITTDSVFIWGAQLEQLPFASSYIPTVASPVARAADVFSIIGANNITAIGSSVSDFDVLGLLPATPQYVYRHLGLSATFSWHRIFSNFIDFRWGDAEGDSTQVAPLNTPIRMVSTKATDGGLKGYANGVLDIDVADTPFIVDTSEATYIGGSGAPTEQLFGHISRLQIFDRELSDFEASIV